MVNGLQGMLRPPDPDPPLRGLWGLLRQAVDPTTPGFFDRGVPGLVKGLVQNLQRNPIETVADFSPLGDAKAIGYDAPRAFGSGNTIGGMLALASAIPGIPALNKLRKSGVDVVSPYQGSYRAMSGDTEVGRMALSPMGPFASPTTVSPEFRRKGVATALYDQAERDIGRRLIPSPLGLSDEAVAFWRNRLDALPANEADELIQESLAIAEREGLLFTDFLDRLRRTPDLPMDEASRMARAREMGFDVDTPLYHGTGRPDRIGNAFSRERATSGPSAFFTDNPEIASNYAADKLDTSRINEGRSFSEMFKFRLDDGTEVPLDEAFSRLPVRERVALRNNLGKVTEDYDADDFALVMGEGPGGSSHWDYAMREARRNPLKAAEDVWLNSAILHGDEGRFVDVLQAAGLPPGRVRFDDPYAQYPGVVPAFIKPGEVLETSNSDALSELIRRLRDKPDTRNAEIDADMWSKDRWSTHEWADALEGDLAAGENSFVWTSIPDAVSDEIEAMGFNTIKDVGGKSGGMGHNVYIPLRPNQIRSRFARFDPAQSESSNLMAGLMGLLGTGALLRANSGDRER